MAACGTRVVGMSNRCRGEVVNQSGIDLAVLAEEMTSEIHPVGFPTQTSASNGGTFPGATAYPIRSFVGPEAPNLSRVTLPGDGLHQGVAWPIRRPSAWLHPPPFSPLLSRGPLQQPA